MKKIIIITLVFLMVLCFSFVFAKMNMIKSSPMKYHVKTSVIVKNNNFNPTSVIVVLPYPQSDMYQSVRNIRLGDGAQVKTDPQGKLKYVRYTLTGSNIPSPGHTKEVGYEFDVTVYDLKYNFDISPKMKTRNDPYVKYRKKLKDPRGSSGSYSQYTIANLPYVDPENRRIKNISNSLWATSKNNKLTYARNAYMYVAKNFRYQNAMTGLHSLSSILSQNGGDCGNLSSIYISLLRNKGIPARHLVGVRTDGTFHAWAEFYNNQHGWIPVDVTYKNSNPGENYFGKVARRDSAIILHKDINFNVEIQPGRNERTPIVQSYLWWVFGSGELGDKMSSDININIRPI